MPSYLKLILVAFASVCLAILLGVVILHGHLTESYRRKLDEAELLRVQLKKIRSDTWSECAMIASKVNQYFDNVGESPNSLDALYAKPDHVSSDKWIQLVDKPVPNDYWGNAFRFDKEGAFAKVWSLGPDGVDGTSDDIVNDVFFEP